MHALDHVGAGVRDAGELPEYLLMDDVNSHEGCSKSPQPWSKIDLVSDTKTALERAMFCGLTAYGRVTNGA